METNQTNLEETVIDILNQKEIISRYGLRRHLMKTGISYNDAERKIDELLHKKLLDEEIEVFSGYSIKGMPCPYVFTIKFYRLKEHE